MLNFKKSIMSLGLLGAIIVPIATTISCGKSVGYKFRGQGSSSVLPVMDLISNNYPGLQYEGTGSGDGLKVGISLGGGAGIANKDFGMTSSLKRPASANEWQGVRTVTWGVDAIAISLHLPSGIKIQNDVQPLVNIEELAKLYDKENNTTTTWADLLENEIDGQGPLSSTPKPLGREGGKAKSGTADGFWHTLGKHLPSGSTADENHENLTSNGGELTQEANSAAYNALINSEGSLTYLSFGYALKNDATDSNKSTVANIFVPTPTPGETWTATLDAVKTGGYKWRRPFNIIYKSSMTELNLGQRFARLLLDDEGQLRVERAGFIALTDSQKIEQFGSADIIEIRKDLGKSDIEKGHTDPSTADLGLVV